MSKWIVLLAVWPASCVEAQEPVVATTQPQREQFLNRFDKDGDGRLSPAELQAARQAWQKQARRDRSKPTTLPAGLMGYRDVEYARVGDKPLLLDLYLSDRAGRPRPVIVWIHGGAWRAGSKERCPAIPMATQGYAVVSINYRLTNEAPFPAQIHDCKAAIRWVRAHAKEYGFDADRIGVWGSSAGGHLVALLGTSGGVAALEGEVGGNRSFSSRVQAVCDFCGPSSLSMSDLKDMPEAAQGRTPDPVRALLGGPISENLDKARQASPISHVTPDDPPFLIVHGDQDPVVPVNQSRILAAALQKAGVEVTLHVVPGAGHGVVNAETIRATGAFFDRHLKAGGRGASGLRPASAPAK